MRLDRRIEAEVEAALKQHPYYVVRLENERGDIIFRGKIMDGMPRGSDVSQPTEKKGVALVESSTLAWLEQEVRKMENALRLLTSKERQFVELAYFKGLRWLDIEIEMNIPETTLRRLRQKALFKVALALGLIGGKSAAEWR